jgi:hypothetical protein
MVATSFALSERQLSALETLANHGGSLPGAILQVHCFSSPTECHKAMNILHRAGFVGKGRYDCITPSLRSKFYYVIAPPGMGLVNTGENIHHSWLLDGPQLWFNLICQEIRFKVEQSGWSWIGEEIEILRTLASVGIVWAKIEPRWPLFVLRHSSGALRVLWILWEGLPNPQIESWERQTRELRQKHLLIAVALRSPVAHAIAKRLQKRGISCPMFHLEEDFALCVKGC